MSREELALETQLLLQEVSQVAQYHQAEAIVEEATTTAAPVSQLEEAKSALLEKLKRKKEQKRQQLQQVNSRRFGVGVLPGAIKTDAASTARQQQAAAATTTPRKVSPMKARSLMKLPVAAGAGAASRKQKDMLSKLRTQAIQQGSQEMAKLFGYASYEEQLKHLNKIEKQKILQHELLEQAAQVGSANAPEDAEILEDDDGGEDDQEQEMEVDDTVAADYEGTGAVEKADMQAEQTVQHAPADASAMERSQSAADASVEMAPEDAGVAGSSSAATATSSALTSSPTSSRIHTVGTPTAPAADGGKRRTNRISVDDDDDGNDADSEQDGKDDDDADADADGDNDGTSAPQTDRAAAYRRLLQAEALATKQRKRLKQSGDFVEAEAEEDEEEDALKIGGLGDFGFGVPQAKTQESKEAEEERNALKLRDDDLDGIVDDLSDDEREQAADLDEIFRKELEDQDRQQVKEVMRNVKEGFGRNRRAFSAGLHGAEARGRFNLDELVAADGKLEAARLGLLESDEELSDADGGAATANKSRHKKRKTGTGAADDEEADDDDDDEADEEDEEAEMERMLRERFQNQPKIYITSSESEGEEDDSRDMLHGDGDGTDEREHASDEERERQQMKLFSERARINRRMQRMKELQRQVALERVDAPHTQRTAVAVVPNLLLEEDEDSQELMRLLNRTDKAGAQPPTKRSTAAAAGARKPAVRSRMGFGVAASARSSSSFSRVAGNVKMFNAASSSGTASSKGFVFTSSFSADRVDQGDENAVPLDNDELAAPKSHTALAKSKSWSAGSKRAAAASGGDRPTAAKKQRKSGFLSALSSFECVSQTTASASSSSQPM